MSTYPPTAFQPNAYAPHRGTMILVLGILSLVVCAPLGIAAWVMGNADLRAITAGRMDPAGRGTTEAGRICGIIGTVFFGLGILFGVLWLIIVVVILGAAGAAAAGGAAGAGP